MKKIYTAILYGAFLFASQNIDAQSVVRSTLCGAGATWSNASGSLTSTFGQCPGCGTLSASAGFITPGFQQPDGDTCFTATFGFDANTDVCGTTYDFIYTGNADVNSVDFSWDFGAEGFPESSTLVNPQGVAFSSNGQKTVALKITGGGCTSMATLTLNVPSTGFSSNPIFSNVNCTGGEDGSIQIEVNGGSAPFNYSWSTGEQSASLENLPAGDYAYTVTDATGCKTVNTATVAEPADSISASFTMTSETCQGDEDGSISASVSGGTPPLNLLWDNGETTPSLTNLRAGAYALTVTDGNGCATETVVEVGQMCDPQIEDVISPNGDGINDEWVVDGIESFPDNVVEIFNRWGQKVWNMGGYTNNWTGTNNDGELLPVGAYFYVVKLNNDSNDVLSGSITIVR